MDSQPPDKPVTALMEMLERDDRDRSVPLEQQSIDVLEDLWGRLLRGVKALEVEGLGLLVNTPRSQHLKSKAEGMEIAISYIEEELRMDQLAQTQAALNSRARRLAKENADAIQERNKQAIVEDHERFDQLASSRPDWVKSVEE